MQKLFFNVGNHPYDIKFNKPIQNPNQYELDELFVETIARDPELKRNEINQFLDHHLNCYEGHNSEFLDHINWLFSKHSDLAFYGVDKTILRWIEKKRLSEKSTIQKNTTEQITPLSGFFHDPNQLQWIESKLLKEKFIDSNKQWQRKGVHLSALMYAMNELDLYKDELLYLKPQEVAKAFIIQYKSKNSFETIRKEPDRRHINKMLEILQKG